MWNLCFSLFLLLLGEVGKTRQLKFGIGDLIFKKSAAPWCNVLLALCNWEVFEDPAARVRPSISLLSQANSVSDISAYSHSYFVLMQEDLAAVRWLTGSYFDSFWDESLVTVLIALQILSFVVSARESISFIFRWLSITVSSSEHVAWRLGRLFLSWATAVP